MVALISFKSDLGLQSAVETHLGGKICSLNIGAISVTGRRGLLRLSFTLKLGARVLGEIFRSYSRASLSHMEKQVIVPSQDVQMWDVMGSQSTWRATGTRKTRLRT